MCTNHLCCYYYKINLPWHKGYLFLTMSHIFVLFHEWSLFYKWNNEQSNIDLHNFSDYFMLILFKIFNVIFPLLNIYPFPMVNPFLTGDVIMSGISKNRNSSNKEVFVFELNNFFMVVISSQKFHILSKKHKEIFILF